MATLLHLSPYATFMRTSYGGQVVSYGISHRLTGDSFTISAPLFKFLRVLGSAQFDWQEVEHGAPMARECLSVLRDKSLLISTQEPQEVLKTFYDWRVSRPIGNPAITYVDEYGGHYLLRLRESHVVRLPRDEHVPALEDERLPDDVVALLSASETCDKLRELIERVGTRHGFDSFVRSLDFLTRPARQIIRLVPPNVSPFGVAVRHLVQNIEYWPDNNIDDSREREGKPFYTERIAEAAWNFDWVEPTVSHAFRFPTSALAGGTYGGRFAEQAIRRLSQKRLGRSTLRVLEVGGGVGWFARGFLEHATQVYGRSSLQYTILDCSRTLRESQEAMLHDFGCHLRFVVCDAQDFSLDEEFDLIVANEVVSDFFFDDEQPDTKTTEADGCVSLATDQAQRSTGQVGSRRFLDCVRRHLAPGGMCFVVEYGSVDGAPTRTWHLNHSEYSVHFGELRDYLLGLGLKSTLETLAEFLAVDQNTEMLCGQQEHHLCMRALFERYGSQVDYCAYTRRAFSDRFGELMSRLRVGGVEFAAFWRGLYFGPDMHQFLVLAGEAPVE